MNRERGINKSVNYFKNTKSTLSGKMLNHAWNKYGNILMLLCPTRGRIKELNSLHYFIKGISTLPWHLQVCGSPSEAHSEHLVELRI